MSASARRTVSVPGVLPSGSGMKVYDDSAAGAGVDLKSAVVIKCRKNWRVMSISTLLGEANCACWITSWLLNSCGNGDADS